MSLDDIIGDYIRNFRDAAHGDPTEPLEDI